MANFIDEFMRNYGSEVTQHMASNFDVDQGTVQKLIPQLAPLILGALSKKRDTSNSGIGGIGALLDADGDGSIIDDVAGFLLKGGSGQTKGKGILGSLLGGLFRKQ
jgi:hypothetical protein